MGRDHRVTGPIPLDGNAAGGLLSELFALDMTAAEVVCGECGETFGLGAARVYGGAMGAIFRCVHCDTAIVRLVRTPSGLWIDMQGARRLFVPSPLDQRVFRSDRIKAVIARSPEGATKQSRNGFIELDCFASLAMTDQSDRNML